ncbi:MAG: hypothetical protein GY786_05670 [Proteobacteria bacterium]|nr:hypothetical protein [Pseudomonadota bacterium]
MESNLAEVFSKNIFKQWGGWMLGISGLEIEVDLSRKDGDKILSMSLSEDGKKVKPDTILSLTSCTRPLEDDDILCTTDGVKNLVELKTEDGYPVHNVDLFMEGAINGDFKATQRKSIKDISGFPHWPKTAYIQPLEGI